MIWLRVLKRVSIPTLNRVELVESTKKSSIALNRVELVESMKKGSIALNRMELVKSTKKGFNCNIEQGGAG